VNRDLARATSRSAGFTLVELLIVIAVVAVILTLAAPSFRDFILVQRLKGTSAQLSTDFQYARSEAIARSRPVFVSFKLATTSSPVWCYTIYTDTTAPTFPPSGASFHKCDCQLAAGSRCADTSTELRTQQIPSDTSVGLSLPGLSDSTVFDPITGGISAWIPDHANPLPTPFTVTAVLDSTRKINTVVGMTGRPQNCLPSGASVLEYTSC